MSYPGHGGSEFEIHEQPLPPRTARQLVDQVGIEAAREALPPAEQATFDQANPWDRITRADGRFADALEERNAFDQDVEAEIVNRGYDAQQAQVVYNYTAVNRQPLEAAVQDTQRRAANRLNTYRENLIDHIANGGLTSTVAARTGQYSMSMSTAQAATLSPGNNQGGGPGQGGSGGNERRALGQTTGNQRRGRPR